VAGRKVLYVTILHSTISCRMIKIRMDLYQKYLTGGFTFPDLRLYKGDSVANPRNEGKVYVRWAHHSGCSLQEYKEGW